MDFGQFTVWLGFVMQGVCFHGTDRILSDHNGRYAMAIIKLPVYLI